MSLLILHYKLLVQAFVDLAKLLLHEYSEVNLLSEKFNQYSLEEHFGRHRARGVGNPNAEAYMRNEKKMILAKSEMLNVFRGNTRGKILEKREIDINDQRKLPKRKKIAT